MPERRDEDARASKAYAAYWKTLRLKMPEWEEQTFAVRDAWRAAVRASDEEKERSIGVPRGPGLHKTHPR